MSRFNGWMAHLDKNLIYMSPETFACYRERRFQAHGVELMPVPDAYAPVWKGLILFEGEYRGVVELPNPFPSEAERVRRDG